MTQQLAMLFTMIGLLAIAGLAAWRGCVIKCDETRELYAATVIYTTGAGGLLGLYLLIEYIGHLPSAYGGSR